MLKKLKFRKKEKPIDEYVDLEFIDKIQPLNNMIFKENYIKKGNGYETCIHIHTFPEKVGNFWQKTITDMEMDNIIVTIDISTMEKNLIDDTLEKNLKETLDRKENEKKITDKLKSNTDFQSGVNLHQKIYTSGISIKLVHIRMYFVFFKNYI